MWDSMRRIVGYKIQPYEIVLDPVPPVSDTVRGRREAASGHMSNPSHCNIMERLVGEAGSFQRL